MRIDLRLTYGKDVHKALAGDKLIANHFPIDDFAFWVDAESEAFGLILQKTMTTEGLWLTPDCTFTETEQALVRYFQLICRKAIPTTSGENDINLSHYKSLPEIPTSAGFNVRLMDHLRLSKPTAHPLALSGLSWAEEFIVGRVVIELLKKSKLQGVELRPIHHLKDKSPFDGAAHLYTENLMPPVMMDASILKATSLFPLEGGVRALGALGYDFEGKVAPKDFNRTAEPFGSNGSPFWVVSRRVMEIFKQNKIKGAIFRPVLEQGTALHQEHLSKWERIRAEMASNPRHRFAV